jgi:hypothetical protein
MFELINSGTHKKFNTPLFMSRPNSLLLAVLSLSALSAPAFGSTYYTDFSGYNNAIDLAGQHGWLSNDPTQYVTGLQNLGGEWGNRTAYIGYSTPSSNSVYVYQGATTPLIDTVGEMNATFSALFRIIDSDSNGGLDSANRDTFGFRLENANGDNLFSFFLIPTSHPTDPENQTELVQYGWSTGNNAPTIVLPSYKSTEAGGVSYLFSVAFSQGAGNDVNFTASVGNQSFSDVLPDLNTEVITKFGAFMNSYTTAAENGSNYMNFDNVSLVPEPSSALLGLLGASFAFLRRRRA